MSAIATARRQPGRRSFWTMVIGVVLNLTALVFWAWGGSLEPGDPAQPVLLGVAVLLQFAAVACLLASTLVGVILLVRKVRPLIWALFSTLALPIAIMFWAPALMIVWLVVG